MRPNESALQFLARTQPLAASAATISFRNASGNPVDQVQVNDRVTAVVQLPEPLASYRELDDDDLRLDAVIAVHELAVTTSDTTIAMGDTGAVCALPRAQLRDRARIVIALSRSATGPRDVTADLGVGPAPPGLTECDDKLREVVDYLARRHNGFVGLVVELTIEYRDHRGLEQVLASGRFAIDVSHVDDVARRLAAQLASEQIAADAVFTLPTRSSPELEHAVIELLRQRASDASDVPSRFAALADDWVVSDYPGLPPSVLIDKQGVVRSDPGSSGHVTARMAGYAVFRRRSSTCIARYYELTRRTIDRLAVEATRDSARDHEVDCATVNEVRTSSAGAAI